MILLTILLTTTIAAQHLQPGFNKAEETEMLKIASRTAIDTANWHTITAVPAPGRFSMVYRSPVVGLSNRWDLWTDQHGIAVISIRGTIPEAVSWLVNFYAAMVPANGELMLSKTEVFKYALASNPNAAVHAGFLTAMAFLSKDIVPRVDSCYKAGMKDFLLTGHSQGGAITYLLTSYLYNLQKQHILPADIRFKTYCGAAPKPGNLYYAYDYEAMTQNGWAFNVVNSANWVPEAGISIQTFHDFNAVNPFVNAKRLLGKQKFPNNLVGRHIYNRLDKITRKAQRRYQRYMGSLTSRFVRKHLTGFTPPKYFNTNNYVRTGATVVLTADADYYKRFPDNTGNVFVHHYPAPYLYLLEKLQLDNGH